MFLFPLIIIGIAIFAILGNLSKGRGSRPRRGFSNDPNFDPVLWNQMHMNNQLNTPPSMPDAPPPMDMGGPHGGGFDPGMGGGGGMDAGGTTHSHPS